MDFWPFFFFVFILLLVVIAWLLVRRVTVFEYERGLLYRQGLFISVLKPGGYWIVRGVHTIYKLDIRTRFVTINGQEVLSADNVSLKISLAASFKLENIAKAVHEVTNFQEALYLLLQLNLREIVGAFTMDELLEKRAGIGPQLYEKTAEQALGIGLKLLFVNVKDIMFPGELKNIFAQVVNARKEGLAALERARGETAALRSLANAASLLESNPNLWKLRLVQSFEAKGGNTLVLTPGGEGSGLQAKPAKKK